MGKGNLHHPGTSVGLTEDYGPAANPFAVQEVDGLVGPALKLPGLKAARASNVSQE